MKQPIPLNLNIAFSLPENELSGYIEQLKPSDRHVLLYEAIAKFSVNSSAILRLLDNPYDYLVTNKNNATPLLFALDMHEALTRKISKYEKDFRILSPSRTYEKERYESLFQQIQLLKNHLTDVNIILEQTLKHQKNTLITPDIIGRTALGKIVVDGHEMLLIQAIEEQVNLCLIEGNRNSLLHLACLSPQLNIAVIIKLADALPAELVLSRNNIPIRDESGKIIKRGETALEILIRLQKEAPNEQKAIYHKPIMFLSHKFEKLRSEGHKCLYENADIKSDKRKSKPSIKWNEEMVVEHIITKEEDKKSEQEQEQDIFNPDSVEARSLFPFIYDDEERMPTPPFAFCEDDNEGNIKPDSKLSGVSTAQSTGKDLYKPCAHSSSFSERHSTRTPTPPLGI